MSMTLTILSFGNTMPHSENRLQSEPDSKAHERNKQRVQSRRRGSEKADETSVGYTISHAEKTALPETVNRF